MKIIKRLLEAKHHKLLKHLMLGLIYPAVLGNIIYLSIYKVIGIFLKSTPESDPNLTLKFIFLFITLIFYFTDYLYIYFTKTFRVIFFIFDFLFVVALLVTVVSINIDNSQSISPPNTCVIVFCYLLFMILYLFWDMLEFWVFLPGKFFSKENWKRLKEIFSESLKHFVPKDEIDFYFKVIVWEVVSIGLLIWQTIAICCYDINSSILLPMILTIITTCFCFFTWRKSHFSAESEK